MATPAKCAQYRTSDTFAAVLTMGGGCQWLLRIGPDFCAYQCRLLRLRMLLNIFVSMVQALQKSPFPADRWVRRNPSRRCSFRSLL
jgi:hypothetical protein